LPVVVLRRKLLLVFDLALLREVGPYSNICLVSTEVETERLTIWDSKESEFASGLEYRHAFDDVINDLDWTSTDSDDAQSILAVGFNHRIVLLCQQRMTYFDQEAAWAILGEVDLMR
jgi:rabconnectin-3a